MPVEGPPSTPIAPNAKRQVIKSFFNEIDTSFPFLNFRENEKVRVEVIKKKRIKGIIFIYQPSSKTLDGCFGSAP